MDPNEMKNLVLGFAVLTILFEIITFLKSKQYVLIVCSDNHEVLQFSLSRFFCIRSHLEVFLYKATGRTFVGTQQIGQYQYGQQKLCLLHVGNEEMERLERFLETYPHLELPGSFINVLLRETKVAGKTHRTQNSYFFNFVGGEVEGVEYRFAI